MKELFAKIRNGLEWTKKHKQEVITGGLLVAGNTAGVLYLEHQGQRAAELMQRMEDDALWGHEVAKVVGNLEYTLCLEWHREQWLHDKIVLLQEGSNDDPPPIGDENVMQCLIAGFETSEYLVHPNLDLIGRKK